LTMDISGPRGRLLQGGYAKGYTLYQNSFQPIEPGEVKRFEVADLRSHFAELEPWHSWGERQANDVPAGNDRVRFLCTRPAGARGLRVRGANDRWPARRQDEAAAAGDGRGPVGGHDRVGTRCVPAQVAGQG